MVTPKSPNMDVYNATTQITDRGGTWLVGATLAADGANGDCDLYDGLDTSGDKKTHLEALSGTTVNLDLKRPILFRKGIFLVCNATTSFVTLTTLPAE